MDQGSNKNHSPAYNLAPTVTKFCVMWEGQALPHDTKFGNCRCKIVDSRAFPSWSLIHGLRWSGLIKAEPGDLLWSSESKLEWKEYKLINTLWNRSQGTWPAVDINDTVARISSTIVHMTDTRARRISRAVHIKDTRAYPPRNRQCYLTATFTPLWPEGRVELPMRQEPVLQAGQEGKKMAATWEVNRGTLHAILSNQDDRPTTVRCNMNGNNSVFNSMAPKRCECKFFTNKFQTHFTYWYLEYFHWNWI